MATNARSTTRSRTPRRERKPIVLMSHKWFIVRFLGIVVPLTAFFVALISIYVKLTN